MRSLALLALTVTAACSVEVPTGPNQARPDAGGGSVDAGGSDAGTSDGGSNDGGSACSDAYEPNDSMDQATQAPPASLLDGAMACSGDEDWYLVLPFAPNERARIVVEHDRQGDLGVQILDPDGQFVVPVQPNGATFDSDWFAGDGPYFVVVTNPGPRDSAYSLFVVVEEVPCGRDRYEDNNSANAATRIGGGLHGDLTSCGDPDYYRFRLDEGQHMEARIIGAPELTLELLDDSGTNVVRVGSQGPDGAALVYNGRYDGPHFLRVSGPDDFLGGYALELNRDVDGNNTCEQAEFVTVDRGDERTIDGTTRGFDNNFQPSCAFNEERPQTAPDAVYAVNVLRSGTLEVWSRSQTEGYDTALAMLSSCEDIDSMFQCNDDHAPRDRNENRTDSRLEVDVQPGTYYVVADGWAASAGDFELTVSLSDNGLPVPNPEATCETAQAVELEPGVTLRQIVDVSDGERLYRPRGCAQRSSGRAREQAFTFTIDQAAIFSAQTGRTNDSDPYDTVLYLIEGCGGHGEELVCNDDVGNNNTLSRLRDVALQPGTYTLVLDAFREDARGTVSLTMGLAAP